jgi:hypothetical protein
LSLQTYFGLKSALSDKSIAVLFNFRIPFSWNIIFYVFRVTVFAVGEFLADSIFLGLFNLISLSVSFFFVVVVEMSSCLPGWPGTHCIEQSGLKVKIVLPQPFNCWDYRSVSVL